MKVCVLWKEHEWLRIVDDCFVYLAFWVFLGRSTAWMLGSTPPWAMVTPERSLFNSSSLRIANCKWRGWSSSSCCHGRRYLPAREPQLPGTPWRRQGRPELRHQYARRSYPCGDDGGFFRLGTEVQLWMSGSWTCPSPFLLYHVQTWW